MCPLQFVQSVTRIYTYVYNRDDLWSVSLVEIFSYDGATATCISAVLKTSIFDTSWKSYFNSSTNTPFTYKDYFLGFCSDTVTKSLAIVSTCHTTLICKTKLINFNLVF